MKYQFLFDFLRIFLKKWICKKLLIIQFNVKKFINKQFVLLTSTLNTNKNNNNNIIAT